jgi:MFS family permease
MNQMPSPHSPKGNYRWIVCILLFFATTINYLDRQVMGLLKPVLEKEFNWTETDYSYIVMAFTASYALGLVVFGRIIDRIGTRLGYTISITFWSIAAMAHAAVKSTFGFGVARASDSHWANREISPRPSKRWRNGSLKKKERLATGIFDSGSNIGACVAPLLIPMDIGSVWMAGSIYHNREYRVSVAGGLAHFLPDACQTKTLYLQKNLPISTAMKSLIYLQNSSKMYHGSPCSNSNRHGPLSSENFLPIRSGISFCSGCLLISVQLFILILRNQVCRW